MKPEMKRIANALLIRRDYQLCGKLTYSSKKIARRLLKQQSMMRRKFDEDGRRLHAYFCSRCVGWHLGHSRIPVRRETA